MQVKELANRYAKAILMAVPAAKDREKLFAEMREFKSAFSEKAVRSFFRSKLVSRGQKLQSLEAIIGKVEVSSPMKNLLLLLAEKSRISVLPEIADAFEKLNDEIHSVHRGTVRSATALSPDERKKIEGRVSEVTGRKVILTYKEDPSMIGGLTAEVGGYLFDDSIKSHVRRLKEDLKRRAN